MRRFRVTVNGVSYEVSIEEETSVRGAAPAFPGSDAALREAGTPGAEARPVVRPAVVSTPPAVIRPAPVDELAEARAEGAVEAPLPGTILAVKVAVGDVVEPGQVLMLLEAMKMENEIVAPTAGRVEKVRVVPGANVSLGDILCVLGGV